MKRLVLLAFTSTALLAQPTPPPAAEPRQTLDALTAEDVQQALTLIKTNYLKPDALTDAELARATLQGLIARLSPGVSVVAAASTKAEPNPFRSEILSGNIGYLRLGDLSKNNVGELQSALKNFAAKQVKSSVLDLRATPAGSDYESAAEISKHFCAKGKLLFTLKNSGGKPEQIFTSNLDPDFQGLLVLLVDGESAGAPEVIAATLRAQTKALVVGEKTKGQAVEFSDLPLSSGAVLRVAVAEVLLPENVAIYPGGVKPDIAVALSDKQAVMSMEIEKGVAPLVAETERVRMNEAALVAGKNPELDAYEAEQANKEKPKAALRDAQLQRALDVITALSVYDKK